MHNSRQKFCKYIIINNFTFAANVYYTQTILQTRFHKQNHDFLSQMLIHLAFFFFLSKWEYRKRNRSVQTVEWYLTLTQWVGKKSTEVVSRSRLFAEKNKTNIMLRIKQLLAKFLPYDTRTAQLAIRNLYTGE